MVARTLLALLLVAAVARPAVAAKKPDPLAAARQFYNLGQYDQAIDAARQAIGRPGAASAARLVMGRSRLERFRASGLARELDDARGDLRATDPAALNPPERVELQIGLALLLYYDDRFGAAAELLGPVIAQPAALPPDARARALDWWATALDRQALLLPLPERAPILTRLIATMEEELGRNPQSAPAAYWIAAGSRASGDLDRAWSAAMAGWVRARLAKDRGVALRSDLDRLVTTGIIPDRAAKAPTRERRQATAALTAEWEAFKKSW